jgi:3-deoxy-manno-octulosonate cytidylyltransferase (CMP-KDO synthetase)
MPRKSSLKVVLIIPARYASSRLPGKPLIDLCGKSMIERTYNQCCLAIDKSDIYIATDDTRIKKHCEILNMQVLMTTKDCLTGTDRVYQASKQVLADIYINVQGDEPIIDPKNIKTVINASLKNPKSVINAMSTIGEGEFQSASVPKVVTRLDNRLLYMSRAGIPSNKSIKFTCAKKQICIYAFPRKSLVDFARHIQKTSLENIEDIEILRFLEIGYEVQMVNVPNNSIAVDVLNDVVIVKKILSC